MKQKSGSEQGLSFRRLAALNSDKKAARIEALPTKVRKPAATTDRQSDEDRRSLYRQATQYLSKVMAAVREDKPFALEPGYAILQRIVDIRSPLDALFLKAIHSDESYDFVVNHSVNVAIYAINMAETLGYESERMIEMGMVGLLHDIGMAKIPEEIIYKKEKLNAREFHLIKERPKLGYEILRQFGEEYAYLPECTLQVYERVDGSGYPRGLKEDEINEYAQLIGLVDMYEALIHTRPQREKILHYYAVKEIIRSGKRQFQQKHLKTLLNTFSIFPIHSYVKLNSNAIGRVIQNYRDQPMRPKLQIVYDSQRKRVLTERIINLPEHSLLYITDAVSEDELLSISEESYLLTKPTGMESYEHSTSRQIESETTEKVGAPVASEVGPGQDHDRSPTASPGSKLRVGILVLALLLIVAGGAWHFLFMRDQGAAPAPASVRQKYTAPVVDVSKPLSTGAEGQASDGLSAAPASIEKPSAETPSPEVHNTPSATSPVESPVGMGARPSSMAPPIESSAKSPETGTKYAAQTYTADFDSATPPAATYPFSIKLTHFRTKAEAAEAASALGASAGIEAYWVKVDLGSQGIWYRVFGGHFETADAADAFIKEHGLSGGVVKATRYANWIGASRDASVVAQKAAEISRAGFSPYMILHQDGKFSLYVGAFYTRAGAETQARVLDARKIGNVIVER